jgi:hypothetical protein
MKIGNNSSVDWTQRVESVSMLRDPIGIWNHHLSFQEEFTPGITSVTLRARYYTIWAYYYQYLHRTHIIDPNNFEKIFILASLAHHDGNCQSPDLIHMYNNQKFLTDWDQKNIFNLDFDINGFGRTYYNRQMEVFRCAWTKETGEEHISKINSKLANTLSFLNPNDFKIESFTKDELKNLFKGFCICQTTQNSEENEILSKLMFGFFSERIGTADIDDSDFNEYMNGVVNLDFIDRPISWASFHDYYSLKEQNSRRRNTLLLFLKIINETSPATNDFIRYIWDAIYFSQNRETNEYINFDKLEKTREYWEFFQLNVYYVFILEKILERIQKIVTENIGIHKMNLMNSQDTEIIFSELSEQIGFDVNDSTTMMKIFTRIGQINEDSRSSLNSGLNESNIYNNLYDKNSETFFAKSIVFLGLLYHRYNQNLQFIDKTHNVNDFSSLLIEDLFSHLEKNGDDIHIAPFFSELFRVLVNRHLFVSAERYASNGTKNWIFTEEDGRLFSARTPIAISPRDNRWPSIRTLLTDLGFVYRDSDSNLKITDKGALWLHQIQ